MSIAGQCFAPVPPQDPERGRPRQGDDKPGGVSCFTLPPASLIAAAHRAQADALEIEAKAKRRLADEYDAAQERGEVAGPRDGDRRSALERPPVTDLGLSRKDIHEARIIRDAEAADPGVVRRTLDSALYSGDEPTKARLREAVIEAACLNRPLCPQPRVWRGGRIAGGQVYALQPTLLPRNERCSSWTRPQDS